MFGNWKHGVGADDAVDMRFMRFNPDGTLAGTQKVQRSMALAADGNNITSMVAVQSVDTAGVVVQQSCATEMRVRLS